MLNFLLTAVGFILSTAIFTLSYTYSGVARTFTSFGKSIAEVAVVTPSEADTNKAPYFDRETFESMSNKYFERNLKRYLLSDKDYSIKYYYFDAFSESHMGTLIEPTGIKMSFSCPVSFSGTYKNSVTFIIKEGAVHE